MELKSFKTVSLLVCFLISWVSLPASAAVSLTGSASVNPAGSDRDASPYMDIGGVWNDDTNTEVGTTGDTFSLILTNSGADPAYDLEVDIALPAGFLYVASTAAVTAAGCAAPVINDSLTTQIGATLSYVFTGNYDMAGSGCQLTFTYGLTVNDSVAAGTYQNTPTWRYSLTNGGVLVADKTIQQPILVRAGDFIVVKEISGGPGGTYNDSVQFDVTVINTGTGGVFDLQVTDTLGTGFDNSTLVITPPGAPPGTLAGNVYTFDYLAPDQSAVLTVTARIDSCADVDNTADLQDRLFPVTGETDSSLASVVYELMVPKIVFDTVAGGDQDRSPDDFNLDYTTKKAVSILVANTGGGPALHVVIDTNLENHGGLEITNVGNGWSFNDSTGAFAYIGSGTLADPDAIPAGRQQNITFDAQVTGCPPSTSGGTIQWYPNYADPCGHVFLPPVAFSSFSVTNIPGLSLAKTVSANRLNLGDVGFYTLTLTGSNIPNLPTDGDSNNDEVTISDTIPAGITSVQITSLPGGTVVSVNGGSDTGVTPINLATNDTFSWKMDQEDLAVVSGNPMRIDFEVDVAPAGGCNTGHYLTNSANYTYSGLCSLSGGDSASFIANESPIGGVTQEFNIDNAGSAPFETGRNDTDQVLNNETGEAEAITYVAAYTFQPLTNGIWAGTVFTAELGTDETTPLTTQTVVNDSVLIDIDSNGAVAVPQYAISTGGNGELIIDLNFVGNDSYANDSAVADHTINIYYSTTTTDADLNGSTSRAFIERVTLDIAAGDTGCKGTASYTKGVVVDLVRAAPAIGISHANFIDVCKIIPVTLAIGAPGSGTRSDNYRIEYNTTNYEFIGNIANEGDVGDPAAFAYSGRLDSLHNDSKLTESLDGAGVRIDFTPQDTSYNSGDGSSSAIFNVRLRANAGGSNMAASLAYDDHQTTSALGGGELDRDFTANSSSSPYFVRQGDLELTVSPQKVFVSKKDASWTIYVTNVGTGVAYNAMLQNTLPGAFTADAANSTLEPLDSTPPDVTSTASNDTMTWQLGNINPGATVTIHVEADTNGSSCSFNSPSPNAIKAWWGCGGINVETINTGDPVFQKPNHDLQITHNTVDTQCDLCSTGIVKIEVKNSGASHLYDVSITENLGTSGLTYVAGTTQVSVNGGAYTAAGNPTISGGSSQLLTWDAQTLLGADANDSLGLTLANMDTSLENTTDQLIIRFAILSPGEALNANDLTIQASGDYDTPCGDDTGTNSPGIPFDIPINTPDITVTKGGWNVDANDSETDLAATVYGGTGDQVIWRIDVTNSGAVAAEDMFLRDSLGGNFAINEYCQQTAPADYSTCVWNNLGDTADEQTAINDSATGTTRRFYVRGTILNACSNQTNTGRVEWGCSGEGGRGGLTTPTDNIDTADLQVLPAIASGINIAQTITDLTGAPQPDTNGIVTITVNNSGGNARNLTFTDTLPDGYSIDDTYAPVISTTGGYTGAIDQVTVSGTATVPVFTLTSTTGVVPKKNLLRYGDSLSLTFRIYQTNYFDNDSMFNADDREESTGDGYDTAGPGDSNNSVKLDFNDSCTNSYSVTDNQLVQPRTPDLDIDINDPITRIVSGINDSLTITPRVYNRGNAVAANGVVTVTIGSSWNLTGALPGGCAGSVPGTVTCPLPSINAGGNQALAFPLKVVSENDSLAFYARVEGSVKKQNGTDTTRNYSLDLIRARILGFKLSKTLLSCSEADSVDPAVYIGEDCTFRIKSTWFGSTDDITNAQVVDTVANGQGFVSSNDSGVTVGSTSPAAPAQFNETSMTWNLNTIAGNNDSNSFTSDITYRTLNDPQDSEGAPNTHNAAIVNSVGASFKAFGNQTFNNATTGYPASGLNVTLTVKTPAVTLDKQVRNVTKDIPTGPGNYLNNVTGDAGDIYEYRLIVANASDRAPAYNVIVNDSVPAKMNLLLFSNDSIDNDIDGSTDGADGNTEGIDNGGGLGQSLQFDESNYPALVKLDPNASLSFVYRVTGDNSVTPAEVLTNTGQVRIDTLAGAAGSQAATQGTNGDVQGARIYSATDGATVTMNDITQPAQSKGIHRTSSTTMGGVSPFAGPQNVVIGEEVEFKLEFTVPETTLNNFKLTDTLPTGISCIELTAITLPGVFVPGGAFPPGATICNDSLAAWNFGNQVLPSGSTPQTITAYFIARVENIVGNQDGATITNNNAKVTYNDTGGSPVTVTLDTATLTVREPRMTVTKNMNPGANADSGDTITVTVTAENTSAQVAAYNVRIEDNLATPDRNLVFDNDSVGGANPPDSVDNSTPNAPIFIFNTIPPSSVRTFTFAVTVTNDSAPREILDNTLDAIWTSLANDSVALSNTDSGPIGTAGDADGMRNGQLPGDGGLNDYEATANDSITVPALTLSKTDQNPGLVPVIGARKQYRITVNLPEGTTKELKVIDNLAVGSHSFIFENDPTYDVSYTLNGIYSINDSTTLGSTAQIEAAMRGVPADETGASVTWDFGTIVTASEDDQSTTAINPRIIIDYSLRIDNNDSIRAGDTLRNSALASYTHGETGSPTATASSAPAAVTLKEPSVTIAKAGRNITRGDSDFSSFTKPDAGDILEYRLSLNDSATTSIAYDLNIVDTMPTGVSYLGPTALTNDSATFTALGEPDMAGQVLTWGRTQGVPQDLDLGVGEKVLFTYRVTVLDTIEAVQTLANSAVVDWTSQDGASGDERTGADGPGGLNNYKSAPVAVSVATPDPNSITKTRTADTYGAGDADVRIGDLITYRLDVDLLEGLNSNVVVNDSLPAGMLFVDTVSIHGDTSADYANGPPFTYTDIAAGSTPAANDTHLSWDLGDITNTGDNNDSNDVLAIYYRARVVSGVLSQTPASQTLTNNAALDYTLAGGGAAVQETDNDSVTVKQPLLTLAKTANPADGTEVGANDSIQYTLTVTNSGTAPAYDVTVRDLIPKGMRSRGLNGITVNSITVDGIPKTAKAPLTNGNFAADGITLWNLDDNDTADTYTIPPTKALVLVYTAQVDATVAAGLTLTNRARVESYYSFDDDAVPTDAAVDHRASFGPSANDSVSHPTPSTVDMTKTASAATGSIGDIITYTLRVPESVIGGTLYDVMVNDSLPANLEYVSAAFGTGNSGTLLANNTSGNNLRLVVDEIPVASRAVIDVQARIVNTADNNQNTVITNTALYTWASSDGGSQNPGANDSASVTVKEPVVTAVKAGRNLTRGDAGFGSITAPDAGDILEYRISVNDSTAVAYDLNIVDTLATGLSYVGGSTTLTNDSATFTALGEPDTSGQTVTWGRSQSTPQDLDIGIGEMILFTYRVKVTDAVEAIQTLSNSVVIDWTSVNGNDSDERNGAGGINDYVTTPATTSTVSPDTNTITKTRTSDTFGAGDADVRIGDVVTFTLEISLQEGLNKNVVINDSLPVGLIFVDTVAINGDTSADYADAPPFTYSDIAAGSTPAANDTALSWNLGNITNAGDNNDSNNAFIIQYRARVASGVLSQAPASQILTNGVTLDYTVAGGGAAGQEVDNDSVTVKQPLLTLAKTANPAHGSTVEANDSVEFTLTVSNTGAGPAHDVRLRDILPYGMRAGGLSGITVTSLSVDGNSKAVKAPEANGSFAADGIALWNLDDNDTADTYTLPAGKDLVLVYTVKVDTDVGADVTLTNRARVEDYSSFDDDAVPTGADGDQRTIYGPSANDSVSLITDASTDMSKTASSATATIGETITYTLKIPKTTVAAKMYDVRVNDSLPANLQYLSAAFGPGNSGAIGLTNSTAGNDVKLEIDEIPVSGFAEIEITARIVNSPVNNDSVIIANISEYTWASANNGPQKTGGNDSASVTVVEPELVITKTVTSGPTHQAGGAITYQLAVSHAPGSTADAYDIIITDTLEDGESYQSLTPNPDNPGAPAIAGRILTWGENGAIDLAAGSTYTFRFTAALSDSVENGPVTNSAALTWTGIDDNDANERTGSGTPAVNDYRNNDSITVLVANPPDLAKSILGSPTYTIGEVFQFRVAMEISDGTTNDSVITDTLPPGVEFVNDSIVNSNPGISYTLTAQPSDGDTGAVSWNFGDISNPDNGNDSDDTITIDYLVRIQDVPGNLRGVNLANSARISYTDVFGDNQNTPVQSQNFTIREPVLAVSKNLKPGQSEFVTPGDNVDFRLTVTNSGDAPAYNIVVRDVLPANMRAVTPSLLQAVLNGVDITGTFPAVVYNSGTGTATWSLGNNQILTQSKSLVMDIRAAIDPGAGAGQTLTNSFRIEEHYSKPASDLPERRQYAPTAQDTADITIAFIHWRPDHEQTTQPNTTVVFPHQLDLAPGSGTGTLTFVLNSTQSVVWMLYEDSNGNNTLDSSDTFRDFNDSYTPAFTSRMFFLKSHIPSNTPPEWTDVTTVTARYVLGTFTLSNIVTDVLRLSDTDAGEMNAVKEMAIDGNCDTDLNDPEDDAVFAPQKNITPGQCVMFRIIFTNEGTGVLTGITVQDETPGFTTYKGGSAAYETTPAGLTNGVNTAPADGSTGPLTWPFTDNPGMSPGGSGSVLYEVEVEK